MIRSSGVDIRGLDRARRNNRPGSHSKGVPDGCSRRKRRSRLCHRVFLKERRWTDAHPCSRIETGSSSVVPKAFRQSSFFAHALKRLGSWVCLLKGILVSPAVNPLPASDGKRDWIFNSLLEVSSRVQYNEEESYLTGVLHGGFFGYQTTDRSTDAAFRRGKGVSLTRPPFGNRSPVWKIVSRSRASGTSRRKRSATCRISAISRKVWNG